MPKWTWAEQLARSPADYLTAKSRLCWFWPNMPLKHANMHAWAEQLHAPCWIHDSQITPMQVLEQAGHFKHAKMSVRLFSSPLKYVTARSRLCRVRANIHLNMPPWAWQEQLHAPRWIPDSQITSMQVSSKHGTYLNMPTSSVSRTAACFPAETWQVSNKHARTTRRKLLHTANCLTKKLAQKESSSPKKQKNLFRKHHWPPSCSHYNTIYDAELHKTMVFRMHPQQRGTLVQPFHWDLQTLSCKAQ